MAVDARTFMKEAEQQGFTHYTGVPCSHLGALIYEATQQQRYHAAANEGDAVALAVGAAMGGRQTVVLMQNSGLGNAVNPLSSLVQVVRVPVLLLVSWRGDPDAALDEPQHRLMGAITETMLRDLQIAHETLGGDESQSKAALARARKHMRESGRAYALLVRRGVFPRHDETPPPSHKPTRRHYLAAIQEQAGPEDVLVATTGYTGRELEALSDLPNQFYLVGAMGCASSVGLGLALARPHHRIIVLDGDGAALMRLSAMTTIGAHAPRNLVHIVFDNGAYESTGGQTTSTRVDFPALAKACGYTHAVSTNTLTGLLDEMARARGQLAFLHISTPVVASASLPRPALSPEQVAARLIQHLQG
jgi:phosphonopyruvate decarboxylase